MSNDHNEDQQMSQTSVPDATKKALEDAVRAYEDVTGKLASLNTQKAIGAACAAYDMALTPSDAEREWVIAILERGRSGSLHGTWLDAINEALAALRTPVEATPATVKVRETPDVRAALVKIRAIVHEGPDAIYAEAGGDDSFYRCLALVLSAIEAKP